MRTGRLSCVLQWRATYSSRSASLSRGSSAEVMNTGRKSVTASALDAWSLNCTSCPRHSPSSKLPCS